MLFRSIAGGLALKSLTSEAKGSTSIYDFYSRILPSSNPKDPDWDGYDVYGKIIDQNYNISPPIKINGIEFSEDDTEYGGLRALWNIGPGPWLKRILNDPSAYNPNDPDWDGYDVYGKKIDQNCNSSQYHFF